MKELPPFADMPPEYRHDHIRPVFEFDGTTLYAQDDLASRMTGNRYPVATWGSKNSAIMDGRAFDMLRKACGDDRTRFENYLRAITDFEIAHSDDKERHEHRTPVEQEILDALTREGYFT